MTEQEAREALGRAVREAGSQAAFADAHSLSAAYVGDVLRGKRELGPRILQAIGLRRVVSYEALPSAQAPTVKE